MSWITVTKDGVILNIHATPRASKSQVQGLYGDALKVRLQAPPVDGKANKYLIGFLAGFFGVPKSKITLLKGATNKFKTVEIEAEEGYIEKKLNQ